MVPALPAAPIRAHGPWMMEDESVIAANGDIMIQIEAVQLAIAFFLH